MDFNREFSKNLVLVDGRLEGFFPKEPKGFKVQFLFRFYGQEYKALVSSRDVAENWGSVEADGPGELFESFVEQLENDHWEVLKQCFEEFRVDHQEYIEEYYADYFPDDE